MSKSEIFATIKEANAIVDMMTGLREDSKEYGELNEALGITLDALYYPRWSYGRKLNFTVQMSARTGHYFVKFF